MPDQQLVHEILSHHYFDMNAEAIYNACNDDIEVLEETINLIIKKL